MPMDIPRRMEVIHAFREQGGSIAAVLPIYYPRELLRAFNLLPVEVWGPPGLNANQGKVHLQPYVCSIVQNALAFLQSGGLDGVEAILVPHACDSLQGLGSILIDFIPVFGKHGFTKHRQPVLTLYLPRGKRASDIDFLANELRSIYHRLAEITSRSPTDIEIMACIHREETADGWLACLHHLRRNLPLTDTSLYRLIRSREYLPAEKFSKLAESVLAQVSGENRGGIPILLSGIVPEPMSLFETITELGGRVVADDLACCGRRLYSTGSNQDPFQRMAERIVNTPPDPMRGSPIQLRLDYLIQLAQENGAQGVVFYEIKFCEPELFDLPLLRHGLRQVGLPSIVLEVDLNDRYSQPVINRLAAFLEMLQ